jgi:hypothetical protein
MWGDNPRSDQISPSQREFKEDLSPFTRCLERPDQAEIFSCRLFRIDDSAATSYQYQFEASKW